MIQYRLLLPWFGGQYSVCILQSIHHWLSYKRPIILFFSDAVSQG